MKKLVKLLPLVAVIAALGLLSGCAAVCGVEEKAPTPPPVVKKYTPAPEPVTQEPTPPPAPPTTYTVEKCDDLYSIAAKPQIYNDWCMWPLIYNANTDKIKDPNKIKEGTVLSIPRGMSDAEKAEACAFAKKFPKYVPPAGAKRYCPPK